MTESVGPVRAYKILAPLGFAVAFIADIAWSKFQIGISGVLIAYVLCAAAAYYLYAQFSVRPVLAWSVLPTAKIRDLPISSMYTAFLGIAFILGLITVRTDSSSLSQIFHIFWWIPFTLLSALVIAISFTLPLHGRIAAEKANPEVANVTLLKSITFFVVVYSTLLSAGSISFLDLFADHIPTRIPQITLYLRLAILVFAVVVILVDALRLFHLTEEDVEREISPRLLSQTPVDSKSIAVVFQMLTFYGITAVNSAIFGALYCILVGREFFHGIWLALKTLWSPLTLVCALFSVSLVLTILMSKSVYGFWKSGTVYFSFDQEAYAFYGRVSTYILILILFSWIAYFIETFGGSGSAVQNIGLALANSALGFWLCSIAAHLLSIFGIAQILGFGFRGIGIFAVAFPAVVIVGMLDRLRRKYSPKKGAA
jgi:hypothetical protein